MVKVLSGLQQMLNGCNSTATWSLQDIQSAAGQKEIPLYLNDKTELGMNESRSRKDGGWGKREDQKISTISPEGEWILVFWIFIDGIFRGDHKNPSSSLKPLNMYAPG